MNGKGPHGPRGPMAADEIRAEILNPFVHTVELDTTFDKIKTAVFTVVLLPFRVVVICYLLVTAWFLACIGLWGLSEEDLRSKPMTGWRRSIKRFVCHLMKVAFAFGSFISVKVRGVRQATTQEAPVICVAPHSSFFDAIILVYLNGPSVVAKAETAHLPVFGSRNQHAYACDFMLALRPILCTIGKWSYLAGGMAITIKGKQASSREAPILVVAPHSTFLDSCIVYATRMSSVIVRRESMGNYVGKLINYTQPVYVWRDDPNSRQNTIKEIIERATSPDWPQILIFPEGTCTNRSCLITFKPGGFYPGVPVQPVTIRYPNHLDTVTWTWEGPSALKLLWLTLTRVHTACEIEFLPVYKPSEKEKKDPKLYASNVRNVMAKALGVPVSDYTYDDCKLICKAKQLNIPHASSLVEIQKLRQILGLDSNRTECNLIDSGKASINGSEMVNLPIFCQKLGLNKSDSTTQALFSVYAEKTPSEVNWPDYLLSSVFLSLPGTPTADVLNYAYKIFDESGVGKLSERAVCTALSRCASLVYEEGSAAFTQVDMDERGWITAEEFFRFAEKRPEFSFLFHSDDGISKIKCH